MMLTISEKAIQFIIAAEDSDANYYSRCYQHFDWPGGSSGPTIGIGYDCGYCTPEEIRADWSPYLPPDTVQILLEAQGIVADRARWWVRNNRGRVTISWDIANRQFREREAPKWIARVAAVLPNCDQISPDSLGALVSLAYNRGEHIFSLPGARYVEGRNIFRHMQDHMYAQIPNEISAMRRLWPDTPGLQIRRMAEAALFRSGLVPPTVVASPQV